MNKAGVGKHHGMVSLTGSKGTNEYQQRNVSENDVGDNAPQDPVKAQEQRCRVEYHDRKQASYVRAPE
jgi:hypothetical protein